VEKIWRLFGAKSCPVFREPAASIFRVERFTAFSTSIMFGAFSVNVR
jgi:hypothetical protein